MSRLHFWLGIGATQASAGLQAGKPTDRRQQIASIIIGILVALLATAFLFLLLIIDQ
jgi:hypothetical protein